MNTKLLLDKLECIYSEYYGEIKDRFQETISRYNTHSITELVGMFLEDLTNVDLIDSVDLSSLSSIDEEDILVHAVEFLRLSVPTDMVLWEPQ